MSFIGGMFGGTPGSGADFQARGANIRDPIADSQMELANNSAQGALSQQQNLQQAISQNNGLANQQNVFGQQQQLAQQLQQNAMGQGPNPVQAMLAQNTGQNTANQAALMANQRGISQNPGLLARQTSMQGANNQQQMAGQAATLGANQQLSAQQALMQQQQAMQSVAGNQVGNQLQATGQLNQAAQGLQGNYLNSIAQSNNARAGVVANQNNANASIAGQNLKGQYGMLGGVSSSLMPKMAEGGQVPTYFTPSPYAGQSQLSHLLGQEGNIQNFGELAPITPSSKGSAKDTKPTQAGGDEMTPANDTSDIMGPTGGGLFMSESPVATLFAASGGEIPNEGGIQNFGDDNDKEQGSALSSIMKIAPMLLAASTGVQVPGKPAMRGNNPKNDTVPAMLSPGEVVIPNSILQSKNPGDKAKSFVEAIMAKNARMKRK